MPVSSALRRLSHVRDVEEEQQRLALETALGELRALEQARNIALAREHAGRELLAASIRDGDATDRNAALVEVRFAARCARVLCPRIEAAEVKVVLARQAYLSKRLERRQAQTLIEEADARVAIELGRRSQQDIDETYGVRRHREERNKGQRSDESAAVPHSSTDRRSRVILEGELSEDSSAIPESESSFNS